MRAVAALLILDISRMSMAAMVQCSPRASSATSTCSAKPQPGKALVEHLRPYLRPGAGICRKADRKNVDSEIKKLISGRAQRQGAPLLFWTVTKSCFFVSWA